MTYCFKDFVPAELQEEKQTFLSYEAAVHQDLQSALDGANHWIKSNQIDVVRIETVVLPSIHRENEEGSEDTNLSDAGGTWHQFFRVWYQES